MASIVDPPPDGKSDLPDPSPIYYRLYLDRDDQPCVVEMQWFDEYDYDQRRFLSDKQYASKTEAARALVPIVTFCPLCGRHG